MDGQTEKPSNAPVKLHPKERAAILWTQEPLPDPTYDPRTGWKLDEFAMYCEPDGLRKYKEHTFKRHFPDVAGKINFIEYVLMLEFPAIVRKRLLEPRFRVTGCRAGSYEPEDIPLPLIEAMLPVIEISELFAAHEDSAQRRYDLVRVFEPGHKAAGGRPATFDWPALAAEMRANGMRFRRQADLVRYCRENVLLESSGKRPLNKPDDKTVRGAIIAHELKFFLDEG